MEQDMNRNKKIFTFFFVAAFALFAGRVSFAQDQAKPIGDASYEAMLYVVLGSNEPVPGAELPKNISGVTRQLRDNFSFSNYRLLNTYIGRIANNGSLEYKSVATLQNATDREIDSPSFLEWSLNNLRSSEAAPSGDLLVMQMFRFGARVPIKFSSIVEGGKTLQTVNYENVGLTVNRLGVTRNSPTLIGTISLPRTAGTVFLVLSVRPV
jgi:hypothetical protein